MRPLQAVGAVVDKSGNVMNMKHLSINCIEAHREEISEKKNILTSSPVNSVILKCRKNT